jgi:uncharacterized membrane protein
MVIILLWVLVLVSVGYGVLELRKILERLDTLEGRVDGLEPRRHRSPTAEIPRSGAPPPAPEAPVRRDPEARAPERPSPRPTPPPVLAHAAAGVSRPSFELPRLDLSRINVPAVLGVVITLLGFSFLLKLAIDHGWLHIPIGVRHLLVAAAGVGLVAGGWSLRHGRRAYSRTLMGGGFATLCLTVYSAVLVFDLIGGELGFGLLVAIVGSAGAVASRLGSRTLAVIGLIGGLSAPLLLPDGSVGLAPVLWYHVLFAAATLGLATRHDWRLLEGLAFCGTFGSAALWTYYYTRFGNGLLWVFHGNEIPVDGPFVQSAIVALFAIWAGMPFVATRRRRGRLSTAVERLLVLGTPFATLGLFALIDAAGKQLAWRSLAIGASYLAAGMLLQRSSRRADPVRMHLLLAAGVAFVALAVPLGLEGDWITVAWATGAAAQAWVATRHRQTGYTAASAGLLTLAALYQLGRLARTDVAAAPLGLDPTILSGIWLAAAALLSAWWIDRGEPGKAGLESSLRWLPFGIGIAAWLVTAGSWIDGQADGYREAAALLALIAATALAGDRSRWSMARALNTCFAPTVLSWLAASMLLAERPLADLGLLAWPGALAVLALVNRSSTGDPRKLSTWTLHVATPALALWEVHHHVASRLDGAWPWAVVTVLLAAWSIFALRGFGGSRLFARAVVPVLGVGLTLASIGLQAGSGDAAPLPFVPLLNPTDLATLAALRAIYLLMRRFDGRKPSTAAFAVAGVACLTMTVLRTVHHATGVPFEAAAFMASMTAQTSLTVTWACAGLAGMVAGTRRAGRTLWIAGAGLMAVVVLKLFTVDLAGVNTAARIVSFLGVGGLLMAVGYLSPVPPREGGEASASAERNHSDSDGDAEVQPDPLQRSTPPPASSRSARSSPERGA